MPAKKINVKIKPSDNSQGNFSIYGTSYKQLLDLCNQLNAENNKTPLEAYGKEFTQAADHIAKEISRFKSKIGSVPFIAVIIVWAESVAKDKVFGPRYIDMMREIISEDAIPYKNDEGKSLNMEEFKELNYIVLIDAMRCNTKWLEQRRENYVTFFIEFLNWLSDATFGYVSKIQDPDRLLASRRQIPYDRYIEIMAALSIREKIIAKIFYLGGNRSSEEVLSLKIEDIDYPGCKLNLSGSWIHYPKHVLEDLKIYIGKRKKGFVFIGRDGERTDPTVPYRALKTVISKLKLDPSFTFKDFGKNL